MAGARPGAVYRVCGFASGLNWRPTRFAEDMSQYHTCQMCRVFPRRAVLLPCHHSLCEPCHASSVKDGGGVCPFDGKTFHENECQISDMPIRKAGNLKAHCWNADHGCNFVGSLQAVLQHFEEQCCFHEAACPRCGDSVLNDDLPIHYAAGCKRAKSPATPYRQPQDGSAMTVRDVSIELEKIKESLNDPPPGTNAQEGATMSALETRMNELVEQTRVHEERLKEIDIVLASIMETPNAEVWPALGKFLPTLSEAHRAQQCACASAQQGHRVARGRCASGESVLNEAPLQPRQGNTPILHTFEGLVSGMVGCLEDIRHCAIFHLGTSGYPSLRIEQVHKSLLEPGTSGRTEKNQLHFLLTLCNPFKLLGDGCYNRTVSAVVRVCRPQQECFTVRVGAPKITSERLEVAFISRTSCEGHHLAKAITVELMVRRSRYSLLEEKNDLLVPDSSGRSRLFYLKSSWRSWILDSKLDFDIAIEE